MGLVSPPHSKKSNVVPLVRGMRTREIVGQIIESHRQLYSCTGYVQITGSPSDKVGTITLVTGMEGNTCGRPVQGRPWSTG